LRNPIYVEDAFSRRAKRMMILPTRKVQERELKTLKTLYKSRAFPRRYGESTVTDIIVKVVYILNIGITRVQKKIKKA
jgi:hypothetical protein